MINNYEEIFKNKSDYDKSRNFYFRILSIYNLSPTWQPDEVCTLENKLCRKLSEDEIVSWFSFHTLMSKKLVSNKDYNKYDLFKPNNIRL